MNYHLKDTIQMFLIGLIPSLLIPQGILAWAVICIIRYLVASSDYREQKRKYSHNGTKEELDALGKKYGFKVADHLFDENGKLKDDIF